MSLIENKDMMMQCAERAAEKQGDRAPIDLSVFVGRLEVDMFLLGRLGCKILLPTSPLKN